MILAFIVWTALSLSYSNLSSNSLNCSCLTKYSGLSFLTESNLWLPASHSLFRFSRSFNFYFSSNFCSYFYFFSSSFFAFSASFFAVLASTFNLSSNSFAFASRFSTISFYIYFIFLTNSAGSKSFKFSGVLGLADLDRLPDFGFSGFLLSSTTSSTYFSPGVINST